MFIPDFDLTTCTVRLSSAVGVQSGFEHKKTAKRGQLTKEGIFSKDHIT